MGAVGLIEEPQPVSRAVEQRRVSLAVLARVQRLQNDLLAFEARIRTEQLRLIAADTGADFATETWVIDVQNGTLERHELQGVVSTPSEPPVTPEKPKRARKPRAKKAATIAE